MFNAALAKRSTTYALVTYLASGVALAAVHMFLANIYEPSPSGHPRFSLFVKSRYVSDLIVRENAHTRQVENTRTT